MYFLLNKFPAIWSRKINENRHYLKHICFFLFIFRFFFRSLTISKLAFWRRSLTESSVIFPKLAVRKQNVSQPLSQLPGSVPICGLNAFKRPKSSFGGKDNKQL